MELQDTNSSLDILSEDTSPSVESNLREKTNTLIETNSNEDQVSRPVPTVSEWGSIWDEVLSSRERFTWEGCLPPLLLGFLPSVWDIASDLDYAKKLGPGILQHDHLRYPQWVHTVPVP